MAWVALEGGDGSGKSTQARRLADAIGAVLTREPGATTVGAELRRILLDPALGPIDPRAEALLMAADRAQHIADVVLPALEAGRHVVSDRSAMSFLAYQGAGRGLDVDMLRRISDWASQHRWPDLVVLIDVSNEIATRRMAGGLRDRLEAEGAGFHDRVRAGFAALAAEDPQRWAVVDGTGAVDDVARLVRDAWDRHLAGVASGG